MLPTFKTSSRATLSPAEGDMQQVASKKNKIKINFFTHSYIDKISLECVSVNRCGHPEPTLQPKVCVEKEQGIAELNLCKILEETY